MSKTLVLLILILPALGYGNTDPNMPIAGYQGHQDGNKFAVTTPHSVATQSIVDATAAVNYQSNATTNYVERLAFNAKTPGIEDVNKKNKKNKKQVYRPDHYQGSGPVNK